MPIAYPSGLLVRERAIIVNLDSIRLITGKDQVCMQLHAWTLKDSVALLYALCDGGA